LFALISTEIHLELKRIAAHITQYIQIGLSLDLCNGNVTEVGFKKNYTGLKFGGNVKIYAVLVE